MSARGPLPMILLIAVQGLDLALHAATGGIEPIRAISNTIIVSGAIAAVLVPFRSGPLIFITGLVYLALNLLFLSQHGLTNPDTNAPRLPLVIFVIGSLVLLVRLRRRLISP
ncbi:MAG: hypothetical protein AAFR35_09525 [Pseudomonadota bacterium]